MKTIANVTVGKPEVAPSKPSHVAGVRKGNQVGSMVRERGLHASGLGATGTARRSTGINARARNPIDPSSPNLSPA